MPVEDLQHPVRQLNDLEIPRIVLEHEQTGYAQRITVALRIVSQRRRNGPRAIGRLIRIKLRFPPWSPGRSLVAQGKDSVSPQPNTRKVMRVKRQRGSWARR